MPNGRETKNLIARPGIVTQPVIFDALSALLARRAGFEAIGLGGYQMGAHLGTSEPLLGWRTSPGSRGTSVTRSRPVRHGRCRCRIR